MTAFSELVASIDGRCTKPGVYSITFPEYLADPCPEPSLSSGLAATLLDRSPRHAWAAHAQLNPAREAEHKNIFDLGSAAHSILLHDDRKIQIIDAADWKTKLAQQARDAAYANGFIPLLPHQHSTATAMVSAARQQLASHKERDALFAQKQGVPELTLVWQESTRYGDVWCRARLDWMPYHGNLFPDYKTTGGSASPEALQRQIFNLGYDMQAAFYCRGISALLHIDDPSFVFVAQETEPPYALSVVGLTPAAMSLANKRAEEAIKRWAWCRHHDRWPGYSSQITWIDPPVYVEQRYVEQELRRQTFGEEELATMIDWQRPA